MYAQAEKELAGLLAKQVYPQLTSVPGYQALLVAGKPDAGKCAAAAANAVKRLSDSGGVREFGSRQKVEAKLWSGQLCRGLGAVGSGRVDGPWWFEAELVKRWERVYAGEMPAKRRDKVMEALRPMLAVCHDWNDMLRLVTMTVQAPGIPVLTGQGTPQPLFSKNSPNYDVKEKVVFIGGFQQVYVPFVPVQLVGNYA